MKSKATLKIVIDLAMTAALLFLKRLTSSLGLLD